MVRIYNSDVRAAIRRAGFRNYEIAAAFGISECTFSRRLSRSEMTDDEKSEVLNVIEKLYKERDVCRQ